MINVAQYYYHKTVQMGGQNNDISKNVCKGLDITRATNYGVRRLITTSNMSELHRKTGKSRNIRIARQKKLSSYTYILQSSPSKRTCSSPLTKNRGNPTKWDQVYCRIILSDYGKSLYKTSSQVAIFTALEGCIKGYEFLHTRTGMLQSDISVGNLIMNEDNDNSSWQTFIINLDFAIKEEQNEFSGAQSKVGMRAFMAIGVLYGKKHTFMHNLESFFWVFFWICINYSEPNKKPRVVPKFEK